MIVGFFGIALWLYGKAIYGIDNGYYSVIFLESDNIDKHVVYLYFKTFIKHTMLEKEFKYYLEHQPELVIKYDGKFIVLKNEKVIGKYESHSEAYNKSLMTEELGTFLIQHCLSGTDSYSQIFHSQVIIHAHA